MRIDLLKHILLEVRFAVDRIRWLKFIFKTLQWGDWKERKATSSDRALLSEYRVRETKRIPHALSRTEFGRLETGGERRVNIQSRQWSVVRESK